MQRLEKADTAETLAVDGLGGAAAAPLAAQYSGLRMVRSVWIADPGGSNNRSGSIQWWIYVLYMVILC